MRYISFIVPALDIFVGLHNSCASNCKTFQRWVAFRIGPNITKQLVSVSTGCHHSHQVVRLLFHFHVGNCGQLLKKAFLLIGGIIIFTVLPNFSVTVFAVIKSGFDSENVQAAMHQKTPVTIGNGALGQGGLRLARCNVRVAAWLPLGS